jgi:hypothetical protein
MLFPLLLICFASFLFPGGSHLFMQIFYGFDVGAVFFNSLFVEIMFAGYFIAFIEPFFNRVTLAADVYSVFAPVRNRV